MLFAVCRFDVVLLILLFVLSPFFCFGQEEPQYDEVTVFLNVQGIGGAEASALIKENIAYLSISDVFTLLKIKNSASGSLDSLSGFFVNVKDEYLIDRVKNQIRFQGKIIELKPNDLILTETNLYMKTSLFGDIFGLKCVFSFRDLSVVLTTKIELPIIREMKMEQMRENLKRLKGEVKTDTTIARRYPFFKFGMADWGISSQQFEKTSPNTKLRLNLGSVVAGGEMNVGLNYDQLTPFSSNQQDFLWRYANNEHQGLRQVIIGKMMPQSISRLNGTGSLIGVQLTNAPTVYRQSFGTFTLSNTIDPGWLVELYVNNVLIDYVKSDAKGFYKFEVPLVYGNSVMKVRMYGPWGEVKEKIENANIPFTFLPPRELEYAVKSGFIEDMPNTKFTHTNINYGVSRRISIGGGYEYFSSDSVTNSIPFVGSSVMLFNNLMLAGEYSFGVRYSGSISYRMPSNFQFDLNYIGYEKGQKAILDSLREDRNMTVSLPIQGKYFSSYTRFSLGQRVYNTMTSTVASLMFSGNYKGISSNISTTASYQNSAQVNAFSDLFLSFRLPGRFTLRPSIQYNYTTRSIVLMRCDLEKTAFWEWVS